MNVVQVVPARLSLWQMLKCLVHVDWKLNMNHAFVMMPTRFNTLRECAKLSANRMPNFEH